MSASTIPFPAEPRVDTRIADDLTRHLQVASIIADPRKRLRATRHAYHMAMTRCRAALGVFGHYKSQLVMRDGWDEKAFREAVESELDRFHQGMDDCVVVVDVTELPAGDESFVPLRFRGRASVPVGRREGHDGFDSVDREISFTADGEVIEVEGRRLACYSIAVDR